MTVLDLQAMATRLKSLEDQLAVREQAVLTLQAELESAQDHAAALQDRLDLAAPDSPDTPDSSSDEQDLAAWVDDVLAHLIEVRTGAATRWCPRWQEHPEAVLRLTAIRQDYDNCLTNPQLGISGWLRTSVDHHLPKLTAGQGPFSGCTAADHEDPPTLPTSIPPRPDLNG